MSAASHAVDPLARQIAELRQVFVNCLTPQRLQKIANALMDKAEQGDTVAARLVLRYGLERPAALRRAVAASEPKEVAAPAPRPAVVAAALDRPFGDLLVPPPTIAPALADVGAPPSPNGPAAVSVANLVGGPPSPNGGKRPGKR